MSISERSWSLVFAAVGMFALAGSAEAQCPDWDPGFAPRGLNDTVNALAVFDDGTGPALYAGGAFTSANGVSANLVAKWNGSTWSPLGSGLGGTYPEVQALAVFNDGSGDALYAGGSFTTAGGVAASCIAKWNGSTWSPLGAGVLGPVFALAVYDSGTGPALYAGGGFSSAGAVGAHYVARWNGSNWSALDGGVNSTVFALTSFDDGSGPRLYAGGSFTTAGGTTASKIARWNGTSWSVLGGGINDTVYALASFDDGSGAALFAGGIFTAAGGVGAGCVAKWNGSAWTQLGVGLGGLIQPWVSSFSVFDGGSGPELCVAGYFSTAGGITANRIAKWNGAAWSAVGSGLAGTYAVALALSVFDDGAGAALYVGGYIVEQDGARNIARWDGAGWTAWPGGNGVNSYVYALTAFDDGSGPGLFAGGFFSFAGGTLAAGSAKWNGSTWTSTGTWTAGSSPAVTAFGAFDSGSGPELFAAGYRYGGSCQCSTAEIARWNGSSWTTIADLIESGYWYYSTYTYGSADASALTVFDDGSGPALYAGGTFDTLNGQPIQGVAKWNGSTWTALGSGISGTVFCLAVFDDGSGPALYAGGSFGGAGGVSAGCIAKWNGTNWSAVGNLSGGTYTRVNALTAFDDGSGLALYAAGNFTSAGGVAANNVARWSGVQWTPLGSGIQGTPPYFTVSSLEVFDDGAGPALYAGGNFTSAGGVNAVNLARWDGASWTGVGAGIGTGLEYGVWALAVFDDGSDGAPDLFAGGSFTVAGGLPSANLAEWRGCEHSGQRFCFGDGSSTSMPVRQYGRAASRL